MMWAISSGAGAGSAVLGWMSTVRSQISPTSMTSSPCPSSRAARSAVVIAAIGAASAEHELDPSRRQCRVDRQIGRPGFEHRQHRHDRLGRAGKQQRHTLPRARTLGGQQVRQPVGGLIEFPVGPRTVPAHQRHRLRGAGHLRGEQHRNRHRAATGWVNTARLPISSRRACSPASSRSIDDSRRVGSAVIATSTRCNRSTSASMLSASNTSVSYSTRRPSSGPGWACTVSG